MIRMAILGSAAALTMSLPAAAQQYGYSGYGYDGYGQNTQGYYDANCERQRRSNQTAGGLFGAVAGGLLGAALADGDDDNDHYRRGHRYSRYGRGYNRGYGRGYHRGYGHRYDRDDDGNQAAGAIAGALIGGVAGSALAGNSTNCNRQAYNQQQPYAYDNARTYNQGRQVRYDNTYQREPYRRDTYNDVRPGEELYGSSPRNNPAWNDPEYGATTRGYNAGYSAPQDTGECRTVYRGDEPATACNVGGDRWEFVN